MMGIFFRAFCEPFRVITSAVEESKKERARDTVQPWFIVEMEKSHVERRYALLQPWNGMKL